LSKEIFVRDDVADETGAIVEIADDAEDLECGIGRRGLILGDAVDVTLTLPDFPPRRLASMFTLAHRSVGFGFRPFQPMMTRCLKALGALRADVHSKGRMTLASGH
jgi:hypothetical protein